MVSVQRFSECAFSPLTRAAALDLRDSGVPREGDLHQALIHDSMPSTTDDLYIVAVSYLVKEI